MELINGTLYGSRHTAVCTTDRRMRRIRSSKSISCISVLICMLKLIYITEVFSAEDAADNYSTTYALPTTESSGQIYTHPEDEKKNDYFSMGSVKICRNPISVTVPCDPNYPYRYPDGTCNNLDNPTWCSSLEPFQRFLPANYEGFEGLRQSVKGGPLPLPRDLSLNINKQRSVPAKSTSMMFPIFGQMLVHDISGAVQPIGPDCCAPEHINNDSLCLPILLSSEDPYYSKFNTTCLNFRRTFKYEECDSDKRQQQNTITGSIDASTTYGANEELSQYVRENDGTGRLKSISIENEDLLLYNEDPHKLFCRPDNPRSCFTSGDPRVNNNAALVGIETLIMREHNRIVGIFRDLNPSWSGEKLYQETRKLVGAQIQCIAFKEFLPLFLGHSAMKHYGLSMSKPGDATKYDPNVQCGVWNSYAHAIGRVHTQVGSQLGVENLRFEDIAGNADLMRHGYMKSLMPGICRVASEKYDSFLVRDMKDHLYMFPNFPYGFDIAAIDIIRGRDHGIPPYVDILNFCNRKTRNITTFAQLWPYIGLKNLLLLKNNYKDVRDVDLWVAAQMEKSVSGTDLGPTAICILGRQFRVLKYGDRFFFEHEGEVPSFTTAQREALKQNCSLSRILCDNNNQKEQQKNALLLPSSRNPILSCDQLPRIDLHLWKENPITTSSE